VYYTRTIFLYITPLFSLNRAVLLRYEYINGEVFAMTGGTKPHNRIVGNLYTAIDSHLGEGECGVYMLDVKVQISLSGPYHYPEYCSYLRC
jgi:Uma2 family endonuclease